MIVKRLTTKVEIHSGLQMLRDIFVKEFDRKNCPKNPEVSDAEKNSAADSNAGTEWDHSGRALDILDEDLNRIEMEAASGNAVLLVAAEGQEWLGAACFHISGSFLLMGVKEQWRRKGAARMMNAVICQYWRIFSGAETITAAIPLKVVPIFEKFGYQETGEHRSLYGTEASVMVRRNILGSDKNTERSFLGIAIGIVAAVLVVVLICGNLLYQTGRSQAESETQNRQEAQNPGGQGSGGGTEDSTDPDGEESAEEQNTGIAAISCHVAEDLPYTIQEESYMHISYGNNGEYPMDFEVFYPQIEGLGEEKDAAVNEILKDCAMSTVNALYLDAGTETIEAIIQKASPVLASRVEYKVTWADENMICVAFNDTYLAGSTDASYVDLRCRTIRLSDAKVYQTAEIVDLSDDFMEDWTARMKAEVPDSVIMSALKQGELKRILSGEKLENRYYDSFFVDEDGLEIGITYHYWSDDGQSYARGWITAPFSAEELQKYETDSDFWELLETSN